MSERDLIIHKLHKIHVTKMKIDLMNKLQNTGQVSDDAITLDQVPTLDLYRAWNSADREGAQQ